MITYTNFMIRIDTRIDTPKYGETLKLAYIRYQPILSYQRFTKCVVYLLVST